eukprot:6117306-Pleurochrysis_carterae.AAC.1
MELCMPGGWVQNFSAKSDVSLDRTILLAMNCVVFGHGAPKVHWSKKMRPTPGIDARRAMSLCVDMSACSALPSMAKRDDRPCDTGDSNMKLPPCL